MLTRITLAFLLILAVGNVPDQALAGQTSETKQRTRGSFEEGEVKKLARMITRAAHPTGKNPGLLKHSESESDDIVRLKLHVEYFGATSNNRYTADALLQIQLPKKVGDPLEVKAIDFVDNNNSIASNRKNLQRLMEDLNARFRIDAAK